MRRESFRPGFTLVELLVVIAIIGVLVGLLLPAVQAAREAARRMSCGNNLKQLGLALHNYHDSFGQMPTNRARGAVFADPVTDVNARSISWIMGVLPYIEQQSLYDIIDFNFEVSNDPRNGPDMNNPAMMSNSFVARSVIPGLICPSDGLSISRMGGRANVNAARELAVNNYKGVTGSNWEWGSFQVTGGPLAATRWGVRGNGLDFGNGMLFRSNGRDVKTEFRNVTDGLSNTLMVGEAVPAFCTHSWWYWFNGSTATAAVPLNQRALCAEATTGIRNTDLRNCAADWPNNYSFMSMHPGGGHFAMGDGAVRFLSETIDLETYRRLGSMMDGLPVNLDQ